MSQPDLISYLAEQYKSTMTARNKCFGEKEGHIDVEAELDAIKTFLQFSKDFMEENRPSTLQHVDGNYLLSLMNGDQVLVCPSTDEVNLPGTTQPSHTVPVGGVDSRADRRTINKRQSQGPTDYTLPTPPRSMKR